MSTVRVPSGLTPLLSTMEAKEPRGELRAPRLSSRRLKESFFSAGLEELRSATSSGLGCFGQSAARADRGKASRMAARAAARIPNHETATWEATVGRDGKLAFIAVLLRKIS